MARKYHISDVFAKNGFGDNGDGDGYVEKAAQVLEQHGYEACIVHAISHSHYINRVVTPQGRTLSRFECLSDKSINDILDKHFPSLIDIEE